ncbi:hypothetical protein [Corynebacterium sp. A21]|uniref:hypothetical protein n=1 Tax=Corynebacterium sp. A21 TaxID=3457318 RepID=UPI003FD261AF
MSTKRGSGSSEIFGFAIADHMRTKLVPDALKIAKGQRGSLNGAILGAVANSRSGENGGSATYIVLQAIK